MQYLFCARAFSGILHNVHMSCFCVPEGKGEHVAPPHDIWTFWMTWFLHHHFKLHSIAIISNVNFPKM